MALWRKPARLIPAVRGSKPARRFPAAVLAAAVALALAGAPTAAATRLVGPVTGSLGNYVDVAASPDGSLVYAARGDEGEPWISVVDTATDEVVSRHSYPSGNDRQLSDLAVSPDGTTLYATSIGRGELLKIDAATLDLLADVSVISDVPTGVAISADGREAFVSHSAGVTVVDTATMSQVGYIRTSGPVYGMAISPSADRLFLSTRRAREPRASILEIADTRARSVISTIDGPASPPVSYAPVPQYFRESAVLSPDESLVYVAIDTTVLAYDVDAGTISVLDSAGYNTFDLAIHPAGHQLYVVTDQGLRIVNTATGHAESIGGLGVRRAGAIAVNPDGRGAYVSTGVHGAVMKVALDHAPAVTGVPRPAVVGQRYDYTFAVSGEPAPTVSVSRGSLPEGLTLSPGGALTGTPAAAGTYEFTITVTQGTDADATLDVTLVVGELGLPVPALGDSSLGRLGSLGS